MCLPFDGPLICLFRMTSILLPSPAVLTLMCRLLWVIRSSCRLSWPQVLRERQTDWRRRCLCDWLALASHRSCCAHSTGYVIKGFMIRFWDICLLVYFLPVVGSSGCHLSFAWIGLRSAHCSALCLVSSACQFSCQFSVLRWSPVGRRQHCSTHPCRHGPATAGKFVCAAN